MLLQGGCLSVQPAYLHTGIKTGRSMKARKEKKVEQPQPFTPGITRAMVRQHAFALFRDKLSRQSLTLEDWVLAEKDLVSDLEVEQAES